LKPRDFQDEGTRALSDGVAGRRYRRAHARVIAQPGTMLSSMHSMIKATNLKSKEYAVSTIKMLAVSVGLLVVFGATADARSYRKHYSSYDSYRHSYRSAPVYGYAPSYRSYGYRGGSTSAAARFQNQFRNTY
jgi:hypothetical protein